MGGITKSSGQGSAHFVQPIRAQAVFTKRELGFRMFQVLDFVVLTVKETGRAPSYGKIRDALGFSDKRQVQRVVKRLERRGLLIRAGSYDVKSGLEWNRPVIELKANPQAC